MKKRIKLFLKIMIMVTIVLLYTIPVFARERRFIERRPITPEAYSGYYTYDVYDTGSNYCYAIDQIAAYGGSTINIYNSTTPEKYALISSIPVPKLEGYVGYNTVQLDTPIIVYPGDVLCNTGGEVIFYGNDELTKKNDSGQLLNIQDSYYINANAPAVSNLGVEVTGTNNIRYKLSNLTSSKAFKVHASNGNITKGIGGKGLITFIGYDKKGNVSTTKTREIEVYDALKNVKLTYDGVDVNDLVIKYTGKTIELKNHKVILNGYDISDEVEERYFNGDRNDYDQDITVARGLDFKLKKINGSTLSYIKDDDDVTYNVKLDIQPSTVAEFCQIYDMTKTFAYRPDNNYISAINFPERDIPYIEYAKLENNKVGTQNLVIKMKDDSPNIIGTASIPVTITPKVIKYPFVCILDIEADKTREDYTRAINNDYNGSYDYKEKKYNYWYYKWPGKQLTPTVKKLEPDYNKGYFDEELKSKDVEYDVTYKDNIVTVTLKGNYSGQTTQEFECFDNIYHPAIVFKEGLTWTQNTIPVVCKGKEWTAYEKGIDITIKRNGLIVPANMYTVSWDTNNNCWKYTANEDSGLYGSFDIKCLGSDLKYQYRECVEADTPKSIEYGYGNYYCRFCDRYMTTKEIDDSPGPVIDPSICTHEWDEGVITKNPTLENEGKKLFTCKLCKSTKTESIPKLSVYKKVIEQVDDCTYNVTLPKKGKVTLYDVAKVGKDIYRINIDNKSVVSMTPNGLIQGKSNGTTVIHVYKDDKRYTINVFVSTPSFAQKTLELNAGDRLNVGFLGTELEPEYIIAKPSIAEITNDGIVTGKTPGKTKVTAIVCGVKYSCNIQVCDPEITGKPEMIVGKNQSLKIKNGSKMVNWASLNNDVIHVDSKGKVYAIGYGTATIQAVNCGKTITFDITVPEYSLKYKNTSLATGKNMPIKVVNGLKTSEWTSSNPSVATIDAKGKVVGIAPGKTTITCINGGVTKTVEITVF